MATAPIGLYHRGTLCCGGAGMVVGEDLGNDGGNALAGRDVEEFVRAVRIRVRAEDAGHDKLRLRKFFAEHRHEWDGAAFAHIRGRRPKRDLRRARQGLFEPRRHCRRVPAGGA